MTEEIKTDLPEGNQGEAATTEESATSETEVKAEETATEEKAPEGTEEEGEKKSPPKGVQKRIDELTKLREEARRDAEHWRKIALDKLEAEKGKAEVKAEAPVNTGKPTPETFKSYDEYVEALTDWKLGEKEKANIEARRAEEATRTFTEKVAKAEEKYPDFKSVALNPDVPITPPMYQAITESDTGADVAYYLGKNPGEAARIAKLSPVAAVKEIGRIEAKLSTPPPEPRRVTKAPEPVRSVAGSGDFSNKDPNSMSMEEYKAWRNQKAG